MVKLIDIAREVGLDVSVVSRTLNPGRSPHPVKKETRELVLAAAERLGYRPNRQAAFLKKGSAATLMCFVPDIGYRLVADLVYGISEAAAEENYPVNFFFGKTADDFCRFFQTLREIPHAAAICYAPSYAGKISQSHKTIAKLPRMEARCRQETLDYFERRKTLLLLNLESNLDLTGDDEICRIPRIEIDEEKGGRQVALHFLECGCTRFYYGSGHQRYPLRLGGYISSLREKGIEALELTRNDLREFPRLSERHGIFLDTDLQAFHLIGLLKENHIPIGKKLLLAGYDDIFPSAEISPSLTTIHPPTRQEGREAVHQIQRCLSGKKIGIQKLEPLLMVRETTGGNVHTTDGSPWMEEKNS